MGINLERNGADVKTEGTNLDRDVREAEAAAGDRITSPDDPRVLWDDRVGSYYLRDETRGSPRTILVFVGVSLGPPYAKGVLQIRVDPAAVRVSKGEKLRWIIQDLGGQRDVTRMTIIPRKKGWAFADPDPKHPEVWTAEPTKDPEDWYVETPDTRVDEIPDDAKKNLTGGKVSARAKYDIKVFFKEDAKDPNSPELNAKIDPDVVYNPPGF